MLRDLWRQHALLAVGAYAVLAVALSAVLLTLLAHTADLSGLERRVYPGVGFAGEPLLDDFSPAVTLGFLDDDPALPRQFFSARWQGFWYVPEAGDYDIHGSGDDRLDVWIDGVLVIRRFPPSEMHTVVRTISLDAGLHNIGIGYEQHGGAHSLRLGWSLPGRRANPLPAHRLFPNRPSVLDLRLALPLPHNFSLDFMKPLRYGGRHGDSESGLTYSTGQPRPVARRAGRGGVAGRRQPRAGRRPRL